MCWWRLSGEGNKENGSPHSWLAHAFTQSGPVIALIELGSGHFGSAAMLTVLSPTEEGPRSPARAHAEIAEQVEMAAYGDPVASRSFPE